MSGDSHVDLDERRPRGDVPREAPPRGARTLTAILPNGRIVWLRAAEPLASAAAVTQVAQADENAAQWRKSAIFAQSAAIERLARTVAADAERLNEATLDRARTIRRRMVARQEELDRRITKAADQLRSRIETQLKIERETLRQLRWRDLWDKILVATSLPLLAAYGQRGQPFGANNLTLTLSLLIWLVGDEIVDALFGSAEASPYALRDNDAWSYIAPIGNVLTGWWLLGDAQHQRFIAGLTPFKLDVALPKPGAPGELVYRYNARVELTRQVAPDHFPDFKTFIGVPVVATIGSIHLSAEAQAANTRIGGLSANVDGGVLMLSFAAVANATLTGSAPSNLGALEIGWIVDTSEPPAAASPI